MGHINLLKRAKEKSKKLIVCVSSDGYLFKHKGVKPVLTLSERTHLVELTGYADIVEVQDLRGKKGLIEKYKPDALFVGDDWNKETYDGEGLCRVIYLPYTVGVSTTWYRDKLRSK